MDFEKRTRYIFGGILAIMLVYFLIKWRVTTLAMKIAMLLIVVDVVFIAFYRIREQDKNERQKKEEGVINISYLITLTILALVTYEFSTMWDKLETLAKIGIVMVDISVIMMIVITKSIVNKRKLPKGC